MTFLYAQTEDDREREHVGRILERLGVAKKKPAKEKLQAMKTTCGVQ
jgi:hypothetical protein